MAYQLNVNGQSKSVDVAADTPLLWVLRDTLNLKGTKFGCGAGLCGACTVHVNGVATRACQTPVTTAVGKKITTLEGLSADGSHPVGEQRGEPGDRHGRYCVRADRDERHCMDRVDPKQPRAERGDDVGRLWIPGHLAEERQ